MNVVVCCSAEGFLRDLGFLGRGGGRRDLVGLCLGTEARICMDKGRGSGGR